MNLHTIYLAGGCFWGVEELMRDQSGVIDTEVGYMGGDNDNPTYRNHPGHAEAVAVTYNTDVISFKQLLDFFFRIHDPTTKNRQGHDIGDSYRSAIFYSSDDEKRAAEAVIAAVDNSSLYDDPVATTLEPFDAWWPAEDYHQDYLQKNPGGYSCHFLRSEKSIIDS